MKKVLLLAAITFLSVAAFAQKYDDVKNLIMLGQIDKAKATLDKLGNEKFYAKPEGYLVKSAVFSSMSLDSAKAADAQNNREESYTAFLKYKEMDPTMKGLEDPILKNGPFNLYASYFNSGVAEINSKEYEGAFDKFKKVVDLSDILIAKKILPYTTLDTNAVYYAGVLAETTKNPEEAVKYYKNVIYLSKKKKIVNNEIRLSFERIIEYYKDTKYPPDQLHLC